MCELARLCYGFPHSAILYIHVAHPGHNWCNGLCIQPGNELDICWIIKIGQFIIQFTLLQAVQVLPAMFLLLRSIIGHWADKTKQLCGPSPNTAASTTLFRITTAGVDELALLLSKGCPDAELQEMLNTASDKMGKTREPFAALKSFMWSTAWSEVVATFLSLTHRP